MATAVAREEGPRCWGFWWRYFWPRGALSLAALLVAIFISLAIPMYLGRASEALVGSHPEDTIPRLVLLLLGLAVAQAAMKIFGILVMASVARDAERDLRDDAFATMMRQDASFYRKHSTGDIVSRLTNDINAVVTMWSHGVMGAFGFGLFIIITCYAMFVVAPELALWTLLPVPLIVLVSQLVGRLVKRRTAKVMQQLGTLSRTVQEDLAGIAVIRSYHLEKPRQQGFAEQSSLVRRLRVSADIAAGSLSALLNAFTAASMFAVLWIGGSAVIAGELGVGTLVQFSAYVVLVGFRLTAVGPLLAMFQRGVTGWSRIAELLSHQPAIVDGHGEIGPTVRGELELRELTLEIEGKRILDRVSLRIPAGSTCAIVGRVGSGKSKLLEVIPRLVDIPAGMVFLDGRDITELPLAAVRGHVAYAAQGPFLFSATVAENIAFGFEEGAEGLDRERVQRAADAAGLTPDLAMLPSGLDTQVGERGITVSGGQCQRIALARTLASAKRRTVILLDDSLSSVDPQTERAVLENLSRELAGKTLVLVSHRLAAIRRADQIAVLDEGKLVELGTHDELLARGKVYAELYRTQIEEATA
jgi:ATP-binding cassette, subfamily B, multidrug efflux pump